MKIKLSIVIEKINFGVSNFFLIFHFVCLLFRVTTHESQHK